LQRKAENEGAGEGLPPYCLPVFTQQKKIVCEDIYHPLLTNPVKNSATIAKGFLLTGCNASGKSTFLKTIAVNAIFAQSIHTCTAAGYQTGFFRIATSMSLKDDILAGDSSYMAEIKAMKRLLNLGKDGEHPALVLADEVLRGTNTGERIAASTQILKSLNHENSLCLAATHDVELTGLLANEYDNYHFEERWENDDIHFPYLLLPGPATTQNAIKLLRVMGYDEELVRAAENALK
jgi:DNA mismatch repair ATPase MutS